MYVPTDTRFKSELLQKWQQTHGFICFLLYINADTPFHSVFIRNN
jgi:hypothetical protein